MNLTFLIIICICINIVYNIKYKDLSLKFCNGLSIRKNNNVLFLLDLSRNKFDVYHQIMLLKYILYITNIIYYILILIIF